ncbi:MAG: hypothetical protein K5770_01615 [Lachnospiraceae bacterium]|nr:hypothetical protein [Lachnospiraceae bacterium]
MNKTKSVFTALTIIVSAVGTMLLRKSRTKRQPNDIVKAVEDVAKDLHEPHFGGLSESFLSQLAKETSRGQKVKVLGNNVLEYYYRSNSGRQQQITKFIIDEEGKLVRYVGMGPYANANSPRFFQEKLFAALKSVNH